MNIINFLFMTFIVFVYNTNNIDSKNLICKIKKEINEVLEIEKVKIKELEKEKAFQWLEPYNGRWKINDVFAYFFLYDYDNPEYFGTTLDDNDQFIGGKIVIDIENKKIMFNNEVGNILQAREVSIEEAATKYMMFSSNSQNIGRILMKEICGDNDTVKFIGIKFDSDENLINYYAFVIFPKGELMFKVNEGVGTYKLAKE